MDKENKGGYWNNLLKKWGEEIKSWFGWGSLKQIVTDIIFAGGVIVVLLVNGELNLANEEINVKIATLICGLLWLVLIVIISYIYANIFLYQKQKQILDKQEQDITDLNEKIFEFRHQGDANKIDASFDTSLTQDGKYARIKITNNNQEKPLLCRGIIRKIERLDIDPNFEDSNVWILLDLQENGPLLWQNGSNQDGKKEIYPEQPEFINIARIPDDMNDLIRGNIIFTFYQGKCSQKAGRYRIWLNFFCEIGENSKMKNWFGCLDIVDPVLKDRLMIWECNEINEWKQELRINRQNI